MECDFTYVLFPVRLSAVAFCRHCLRNHGTDAFFAGPHHQEPIFIADYSVKTELPEKVGGSARVEVDICVHESVTSDIALPTPVVTEAILFDTDGRRVSGATATPHQLFPCDPLEVHGQPFEKSRHISHENVIYRSQYPLPSYGLQKPRTSTHLFFVR